MLGQYLSKLILELDRAQFSLHIYLPCIYLNDLAKLCSPEQSCFVILYADDILIISPSVVGLELLLHRCELELIWLDMAINFKKSCCMRIGPRCDTAYANVCSITGHVLHWVTELRFLGVFIVRSRNFKCSLDAAKRSFYRAANAIFGKVGRIASEDVTLQLLSSKCIPLLLYGLESFPLSSLTDSL